MTQTEDLPEPNGPIRPRMKARDWLKRLIVGTLAYEYERTISNGAFIPGDHSTAFATTPGAGNGHLVCSDWRHIRDASSATGLDADCRHTGRSHGTCRDHLAWPCALPGVPAGTGMARLLPRQPCATAAHDVAAVSSLRCQHRSRRSGQSLITRRPRTQTSPECSVLASFGCTNSASLA